MSLDLDKSSLECFTKVIETTSGFDIDSQSLEDQEEISQILKNKRYEKDTASRTCLAYWTFIIISAWLVAVFLLLIFNIITIYFFDFVFLSDKVYITLLATTTANIIGLPAIVLKGYFNK